MRGRAAARAAASARRRPPPPDLTTPTTPLPFSIPQQQGEPLIVTLGWAATCAMFSFSLALVVWGRSGL
jgi:hypothetical protein